MSALLKGALTKEFKTNAELQVEQFTNSKLDLAKKKAGHDAINGREGDIGKITSAAGQVVQEKEGNQKAREKDQKNHRETLRLLDQLEQMRRDLLLRITQLQEEIDRLMLERDELHRDMDALKDAQAQLNKDGQIELDEYGEPKNPRIKAMAEEYTRKTGKKVDFKDKGEVEDFLDVMLAERQGSDVVVSQNIEHKQEELDKNIQGLENLKSSKESLERSNENNNTISPDQITKVKKDITDNELYLSKYSASEKDEALENAETTKPNSQAISFDFS